jgi:hypothetical protein
MRAWRATPSERPQDKTRKIARAHSLQVGLLLRPTPGSTGGNQVQLDGEEFYQITDYDRLKPFFMSVVSNADHWMFVSSTGALTAGRRNPDLALFPYYTDDKIHDSAEITGPKTILLIRRHGGSRLWEPFSERYHGLYKIRRNLLKNYSGNKILFEEINPVLGLAFRYGWFNTSRFGFVRKSWLTNISSAPITARLLDGIQNVMPWGVGSQFQLEKSTLLDAYKRNELIMPAGIGLFRLSSVPIDRPEPAEALKASTVFALGLDGGIKLLSSRQLDGFRSGNALHQEYDVRGARGAYFRHQTIKLGPGRTAEWWIVADVGQDACNIAELKKLARHPATLMRSIDADITQGTEELRRLVGSADGFQKTARSIGDARHYGNALFNIMRGGVFQDGYWVNGADFQAFVRTSSPATAARNGRFFRQLGQRVRHERLLSLAVASSDPQLERICREYLPLMFSRRHGDPSRPWNKFSISARNNDGTRMLDYEGNWRDIFQNWEALALSFPGYVAAMVCKFVNASTLDGYNPYRVTRSGFEWERLEPHDPWAYIGYWGDHQIIYLLKLLEVFAHHDEPTLREFLRREIFASANVPYRIKPFDKLIANPKETVVFDNQLDELIQRRIQTAGADGKLVWNGKGEVRLVNLAEKLLTSVLAKLSNFVPGAGIWLNTQRPEWNDANNALVGNGVSVVTLCYLRRHLTFCRELFLKEATTKFPISVEVAKLFCGLTSIFKSHIRHANERIDDRQRRKMLDELGRAGSEYRRRIYNREASDRKATILGKSFIDFFDLALEFLNHAIKANRRLDGLYHAYNLIRLDRKVGLPIGRLYEMLEGQVAALSSGHLTAEDSLHLLKALRQSRMYRADQHSYMLYPDRKLPKFMERNNIPSEAVKKSALIKKLLASGNEQLVQQDVQGKVHFNSMISNARDIWRILPELSSSGYAKFVHRDETAILALFEDLFDHSSFTGRSGTFFGYEGLGCIYWHMVSKLLVAAQEAYFRAAEQGAARPLLRKLADCYYDIRAGLADYKSPVVHGGFPMDPYSHTPGQGGARQPGLTGQVKEDILCRFGELGVFVRAGALCFQPELLRREEFMIAPGDFNYFDVFGVARRVALKPGSLAFTYCQVPIIYRLAPENSIVVVRANGATTTVHGSFLDSRTSQSIFRRTGDVVKLEVANSLTRR